MGIIKNIFSGAGKEILTEAGAIVDNLTTSNDEKSQAKAKLTEIVMKSLSSLAQVQGDVIQTEMKGNWLQRTWRPLLMLTFAGIIVSKWFGLTDANISQELELKLLDIIYLGLGGYVIGRSVENTAEKVTKNIDIPFLKKKDRKSKL